MPLAGMKLTSLNLYVCYQVRDLTPLKGMPLTTLHLQSCPQVRDLTPLAGMKLAGLYLPPKVDAGMDVVRKMTSLQTIDGKPAAQFWKEYDAKKAGK
jgi:hypothetical protein